MIVNEGSTSSSIVGTLALVCWNAFYTQDIIMGSQVSDSHQSLAVENLLNAGM